mmetsp:Transcript_3732/g.8522  ORF Transcript_3732/g.8522 Transcript_3732/m.8522 type:complete len:101 (+) Transcript_3732:1473-1775(+)
MRGERCALQMGVRAVYAVYVCSDGAHTKTDECETDMDGWNTESVSETYVRMSVHNTEADMDTHSQSASYPASFEEHSHRQVREIAPPPLHPSPETNQPSV